jgi:hypothetical protein
MYSPPANDNRYAEKGVGSDLVGDRPPKSPGLRTNPDDMYVTGKGRQRKKGYAANSTPRKTQPTP